MLFLLIVISCVFQLAPAQEYESLFPDVKTLKDLDLSPECLAQISVLDQATLYTMADASTKIPAGLFYGNMYDLGQFDECYGIETDTSVGTVYGKYCLGTAKIPFGTDDYYLRQNVTALQANNIHPPNVRILPGSKSVGFIWAMCVPDKCSAKEVSILEELNEAFCYSKNNKPEISTGAIITLVFLGIFISITILSTMIDLCFYYSNQNPPHELWIAFSVLSNGRKLFKSTKNPDQLLCLNGLRAISMMWVIIGHNYNMVVSAPLNNLKDLIEWTRKPISMWLMGATVSVDTFFVAAGLVTVYTFMRSRDKGVKFNIFLYYIHRFLRLAPAFGVCILIYANLLRYFGNGPFWNSVDSSISQPCIDRWWITFFYLRNYVEVDSETCMGQTWYLSVDMQLFLLSPIVLIPLSKSKKYGLGLLNILIIFGMIVPGVIGYIYEIGAFFPMVTDNYNSHYYCQTHCRFGPYVIGMALGYILYEYKKTGRKPNLHPHIVVGIWLITLIGLIACVWSPFDASQAPYDKTSSSLFLAFQRPAWSLGVAIVIYLCVTGYGKPIDLFLSLPIFQFLTKVSYSMYLVHAGVIIVRYLSLKTTFYFSDYQMMMSFWGDFMLTLALSILLCLMFESPIIIIEKHLFGRGKTISKTKETA